MHQQGTPGGDFAELATAIVIYLNQTGTNVSDAIVKTIFDAFMAAVPTTDRPFYYHTSDEKLHKVFHDVEDAGVKKPTVFPEMCVGFSVPGLEGFRFWQASGF